MPIPAPGTSSVSYTHLDVYKRQVFLERYVERARHVEVQILGDRAGHLLHLYERDCSVQRRHQKVVEVAPAVGLDDSIRRALAEAAVKLANAAGYYNAGTVEFLVDADSGAWYFIEVNPRIQVEHTVTEMVTGIDLVQCQIQVAQGLDLFGPEMHLPPQEQIPLYGYALQCRITTEDPGNSFVPDYGKIHTYRSPAGFGIRLDGGSAYSGAVITPYYDSLLVKTTAWGREFGHACQRMDRCLREFRVRGVKTNIPFLENVVNHADFQAGRVTTRWLEETPALFRFSARRDRATRILSYLGEVIVNGNPTVAGKTRPHRLGTPPVPRHDSSTPPDGTRQLLQRLGPEGFAQWTLRQKRLLLTDTTIQMCIRDSQWSEQMLTQCSDFMRLISEHAYWQNRPDLAAHVAQIPAQIKKVADAHREYRKRIPALAGKDIRIAMDEWNYWYGPNDFGELGVRYFMQDALGIAAGLHEFFRNSDIFFMANYAQTVNVIGAIKTTPVSAEMETTGLVLELYLSLIHI